MSVLLLNASYEPLAVVSWKRAMTLVLAERAEMVEQEGDRVIRSAGGAEYPCPLVIRLMKMVSFAGMRGGGRTPRLSRSGLAVRDARECQVSGCDERGSTVDHIVPRSRGGETSWLNCVLMCQSHNSRKSNRLLSDLGWQLKKRPHAPTGIIMLHEARHPSWAQWAPV